MNIKGHCQRKMDSTLCSVCRYIHLILLVISIYLIHLLVDLKNRSLRIPRFPYFMKQNHFVPRVFLVYQIMSGAGYSGIEKLKKAEEEAAAIEQEAKQSRSESW